MTLKMEHRKEAEAPAKRYRYSIPSLTEIGCNTRIPVDIANFNVDAIQGQSYFYPVWRSTPDNLSPFTNSSSSQILTLTYHLFTAGIVTGPGHVSKPIAMPLSDPPLNRDRGWSVDSLDSMEDYVVFPGSGGMHPCRQPRNAPSEARTQSDEGFARFLKQHSSPTHQRVIAGGCIVPMEPNPTPPQFNLPIDNLGRSKDNTEQQKKADDQKMGNPHSVPDLNTAVSANADLPSADSEHNQQTFNPRQGQDQSTSNQESKLNTSFNFIDRNRMPRPSDLAQLTSTNATVVPKTFTNFSSSINLNPQTLTHNQWGTPALPLSGVVFNPYNSMPMPRREQQPILPMSIAANAPFSAVTGVDQMNIPVAHGENFERFIQKVSQAGFPTIMPNISTPNMPVSYPSSLSVNNGMTSIASPPGDPTSQIGGQIGGHLQAGYSGQVSATDMQFNNMTMNHSWGQPSNVMARKVTKEDIALADNAFRELDLQLQGHDQFTARYHSSFTPPMKSYYVRQRMNLVEQRDMARRKLTQLRCALEEERSTQGNPPAPADHQKAWSTKAMTSASTLKSANANADLNIQAASWVPGQLNKGNSFHANLQHIASNESQPATVSKPATHPAKTPADQASFARKVSMQVLRPRGKQQNMCSITASVSPPTPGPYTKQLNNPNSELSDLEIDEWGACRGCAPPEVAQKQSGEEMKIRSQQHDERVASVGSAPAGQQPNIVPTTISSSPPYPVDEWGDRLGRTPAELAKQQNEQNAKLANMPPHQRNQISLATLDRLPSAKAHAGKTVKFAENNADTIYRCGHDPVDDASSVGSSDETGWRPMKRGQAPPPTQADWQALFEAACKEKGVKTEFELVTGISVIFEGRGPGSPDLSTAEGAKKDDESGQNECSMLEQERAGIDNEVASLESGVRGLEVATRNQGGPGFKPWAHQDEGNPFRNKGPSSVALQSTTARGMMPAFDGAGDRTGQNGLNPVPKIDQKANGSPSKVSSPPKRSLRDIWGVPPKQVQVEAAIEEEDMSDVKTVMYKY